MMEALKCQLEGNSGRKFNRVARISGYFWLQQESSTGLPESVGISGIKFNRVARISGYFWFKTKISTGLPESVGISGFVKKVQQGCQS